MYARVSTIYGTAELGADAEQMFRDEVLSALKETEGSRGAILMTDRATGKSVGITLWESEEAMRGSEERANELRRAAAESAGASEPATVDRYEVVVWEV